MKSYITLYSNCILVKGYKKSFIVDLQQSDNSISIPNSFYHLLTKSNELSLQEILSEADKHDSEVILENFKYLLGKNLAFESSKDELNCFPELSLEWETPSLVENAIMDFKTFNLQRFKKVISELEILRCNCLQLRFIQPITKNELIVIGEALRGFRILSIELIFQETTELNERGVITLIDKYPMFNKVIIYNSDYNKSSKCGRILSSKKLVNFEKDCGVINPFFFTSNINLFTESQHYNTCLNKKVSIDSDGFVKNCPSMGANYGCIDDNSLVNIISNDDFKRLWSVAKDDIDVCKDCEYRHICTDCRAFVDNPSNLYSRPSKCTYNPYIAKWEGEEGYHTLKECGVISNAHGFSINHEKIAQINKELWGE